jgi:hypothetical protein
LNSRRGAREKRNEKKDKREQRLLIRCREKRKENREKRLGS